MVFMFPRALAAPHSSRHAQPCGSLPVIYNFLSGLQWPARFGYSSSCLAASIALVMVIAGLFKVSLGETLK